MGTNLTRRQVAKGAAWTAPAVTLGAPSALAATSQPCTLSTATWINNTSPNAATATDGTTATSAGTTGTSLKTDNFTQASVNNGSPLAGAGWLVLDQSGRPTGGGQTVTITLPVNAYCVAFYINDIDTDLTTNTNRYQDQVVVSGFTASTQSALVTVTGGTARATNKAMSTSTGWEQDNITSAQGLAKFTATGPVKSFTITYTNLNPGNGGINDNQQQVYISPIKYSTGSCAC